MRGGQDCPPRTTYLGPLSTVNLQG